jgi:hypothetical protein
MKRPIALTLLLAMAVTTTSCLRDREFIVTPNENAAPDTLQGDTLALMINEFVAKGPANANEFGANEDWIELFNPSFHAVYVPDSTVFVTDDFVGTPDKYPLPAMRIPARGFVVVWADDLDTVATQIHTNFKLSSTGEYLGLSFGSLGATTPLDSKQYGDQAEDAVSNGRSQDGAFTWTIFPTPTPGNPNQ